jgi:hypothetical protein
MATNKPHGQDVAPAPANPPAPVEPAREANHPDEPKRPAPTATPEPGVPRAPRKPDDFTKPEPLELPPEHKRPSADEFVKAGNRAEDYERIMAEWEQEIRDHLAVGHKYQSLVKRLWNPLVPKRVLPSPRLREGMVRVKALATVLANGMAYQAGDVLTMPQAQAERAKLKGSVKILKS